jgi:hypothetical protein
MNDPMDRRLDRLETIWSAPAPRCPVCQEAPIREVVVDAITGETTSESVPSTGCVVCGHRPFRELRIVVDRNNAA